MPVAALRDLLELADAGVWGDEDPASGTSVLRSTNFRADGRLDFVNLSFRKLEEPKRTQKTLRVGDILLEKSGGGPKQPVGRVCLFRGHEQPHAFGNFLSRLRPRRDVVEPEYLFYRLWHFHDQGLTTSYQKQTSGIRNLETKRYLQLLIDVPPLSEQRRVVDLLSRAENIVRMRREAEQKAKEIIPALFLEMFGDPAKNPKGWDIARVEDCCTLVRGSSPRPQGDPRYFGGPVPRLMIADITRDGIYVTPRIDSLTPAGAERSRPMKCGDVVMAVSGACGLPAILAVDACIHDGFVGFRSLNERIRAEYLCTFLAVIREETEKQAVGATFQNLKTDQIRAWKIPIPPIQIQDSFVARAKSLRRLGDDIAHASRYADSTFQSLLTLVFGEAV